MIVVTALIVITLCLAVVLYCIVRGPSAFDRGVAVNGFMSLSNVFLLLFCVYSKRLEFIDIVIAYSMIGFLSSVGLLRYLSRVTERGKRD